MFNRSGNEQLKSQQSVTTWNKGGRGQTNDH